MLLPEQQARNSNAPATPSNLDQEMQPALNTDRMRIAVTLPIIAPRNGEGSADATLQSGGARSRGNGHWVLNGSSLVVINPETQEARVLRNHELFESYCGQIFVQSADQQKALNVTNVTRWNSLATGDHIFLLRVVNPADNQASIVGVRCDSKTSRGVQPYGVLSEAVLLNPAAHLTEIQQSKLGKTLFGKAVVDGMAQPAAARVEPIKLGWNTGRLASQFTSPSFGYRATATGIFSPKKEENGSPTFVLTPEGFVSGISYPVSPDKGYQLQAVTRSVPGNAQKAVEAGITAPGEMRQTIISLRRTQGDAPGTRINFHVGQSGELSRIPGPILGGSD